MEQLYLQLNNEQKEQIEKAEIRFIEKLSTEWEPDKNACCTFFQEYHKSNNAYSQRVTLEGM